MITRIVTVEILAVGLSGVFLTPILLIHALGGSWLGLNVYIRAAAWGGVLLVFVLFAATAVSR